MPYNPFYFFNSPLAMEKIEKLIVEYKNQQITIDELIEKINAIEDVEPIVVEQLQKMYDNGTIKNVIQNIIDEYISSGEENSLKVYIKNIFENIINGYISSGEETSLKEYIKNIIDGYITSGEETSLKKYIDNALNQKYIKVNELSFNRFFRAFHRFRNLRKEVHDSTKYNPNWCQGSTIWIENDSVRFMGCYSDNSDINPGVTERINTMQILRYDSIENSTSYTASPIAFTLGHGNGMCRDNNGYFYIPFWSSYPTTTSTSRSADYHIARIRSDFSEYEVKEFVGFRSPDLAFDNGKLYAYDYGHQRVVTFNWETEKYETVCKITKPFVPKSSILYPLCFDICDNIMYAVYDNYQIGVYNLSTGKLEWVYNIPHQANGFLIPEIESINVMSNGDMYIITQGYLGSKGQCQLSQTSVFLANIKNNNSQQDEDSVTVNASNIGRVVYVNPDPYAYDNPNPNGYGQDQAFRYLQEAVDWITYNKDIDAAGIRLLNTNTYDTQITTSKPITIIGYGKNGATKQEIGGIYGDGCNLFLEYLTVKCSAPYSNSVNTVRTAPIMINNGKISSAFTTINCSSSPQWYTQTSEGVHAMNGSIYSQHRDNTIIPSGTPICVRTNGSLFFNGNTNELGG